MANYQLELTGAEINQRLMNIGKETDEQSPSGSIYARIAQNTDDIVGVTETVSQQGDDIAEVNTKLNIEVVSDTITRRDASQFYIEKTKRNLMTGAESKSDVVLTGATAKMAGVMRASDYMKLNTAYSYSGDAIMSTVNGLAVDRVAYFSLTPNTLSFIDESGAEGVHLYLYRWTGNRYAKFILWESGKKTSYALEVDADRVVKVRKGDGSVEDLADFVKRNGERRNKWCIQAFFGDLDIPLTGMFTFAVSRKEHYLAADLDGTYISETRLVKTNGSRYIPRRQETRLAHYYDASRWTTVGDNDSGLRMRPVDNRITYSNHFKFPCAGDIVRNGDIDGTVMYVEKKSDGSYGMTWCEAKKVFAMSFETYTFSPSQTERRLGMRVTKAATEVCGDITAQTKGGTLRDLYIKAGAAYNEQTGYYELNGLNDITEEEMKDIWMRYMIDSGTNRYASGWLSMNEGQRTNLPSLTRADIITGIDNSISGRDMEVFNIAAKDRNPYGRKCYIGGGSTFAWSEMPKLKKVLGVLRYNSSSPGSFDFYRGSPFSNCPLLEEIRIERMNKSHSFAPSANLSKDSVLYMIQNATPSSDASAGSITITLHASAYERLKDDTDILAAIEEKNGIITITSA